MKLRATLVVLACALVATACRAQETSPGAASSDAPLWEVQFDMQKFFASPFGQKIMEQVIKQEPEVEQKLNTFANGLGIDFRTAIGPVRIYGNSFEPPNTSKDIDVSAVASLGESRGNIEGFILAAPGYESEELTPTTLLHSFKVEEGDHRIWCALPKNKAGHYTMVLSFNRENAIRLAGEAADNSPAALTSPLTGDTLLAARVNDLASVPFKIDENDPGAGLIKAVRSVMVNVATSPQDVSFRITIEADSPARAEQIHQLLVGLKAMLQLAAPEDDDAQQVLKFVERLASQYEAGKTEVSAEMSISQQEFAEFLEKNI